MSHPTQARSHLRSRRQVLDFAVYVAACGLLPTGCANQTRCPSAQPTECVDDGRPEASGPLPALDQANRAKLESTATLPIVQHDPRIVAGATPAGTRRDAARSQRRGRSPLIGPSPAGVLRRRALNLTAGDAQELARLERRMAETLASTGRGVGLAAPQVGIGVRAILVMLGARSDKGVVRFYSNPRIVERSDEITLDYEGCLSVPDVCGLVRRNRRIVIEHGLPKGRVSRLEVSDFDARIFQHEIDHLDGVLYIDRVEGGIQPKEKLRELREELKRREPKVAQINPRGPEMLL